MPSQGPRTYATATEDPNINDWLDQGAGISENGAGIRITSTSTLTTLTLHNFGFTIPGTATIDGVEITDLVVKSTGTGPFAAETAGIRFRFTFDGGSTVTGDTYDRDFSSIANSGFRELGPIGGPSSLHSAVFTPAGVNGSGFGVKMALITASELTLIEIDYFTLTIYYSDAGGGVIPSTLCSENMHYIAQGIRCADAITKRT